MKIFGIIEEIRSIENKQSVLQKAISLGIVSEDILIEKARSGIYLSTPENKKLGRVGQKYGGKQKENEINSFTKELQYAEQVIKGVDSLKRLSPAEEQGRLLGGRRNVEATIIAGANESTDGGISKVYSGKEQEVRLKEYAIKEGIWIEDYLKTDWGKKRIGSGGEAYVYKFDDNHVYKVHHFPFEQDPIKFCDRIAIHNLLFPECKYEVVGFTGKDNGKLGHDGVVLDFAFIIKQPFIVNLGEPVFQKEVNEDLIKRGFVYDEDADLFMSNDYVIGDTHPGNVLRSPKGNLIYIDPIIELNTTEAGYGGSRILGNIEINKSLTNDIEKAKRHPIGTIVTRQDGQKYKKVAETGNSRQDWKLVAKDKTNSEESTKERTKGGEQGGGEINAKDLPEQAKNTSESALQNTIKQSPNPELRQAAHKELERRQNEEVPKEDKGKIKNSESKRGEGLFGNDKISTLDIIENLNEKYKKDKIRFSITGERNDNDDYNSVGISYGSLLSNGEIEIYLNDDAYTNFQNNEDMYGKSFEKYFNEVVQSIKRHEEIHKKYGDNLENPENEEKYLSNGNEIKAQSQSIIDDFRRKGYKDEEIKQFVLDNESGESKHFDNYLKVFGYSGKVINNLKNEIDILLGIDKGKIVKSILGEENFNDVLNKPKKENEIKGGKADNLSITDIAKKHKVSVDKIKSQLIMGVKVEMEHTDSPKKALEIAMDHLVESPVYYTKLKEMEESFED